jgi:NhaP-type Na+/H+ or K+/H+ antiporter
MLESPIGEALCVVIALALLQTIEMGRMSVGLLLGHLMSSFVFAIVLGALSGYVWSLTLDRVRQLRNAIFLTPSAVFIVYGLTEFFGFSGPIAALAFGIVLGNVGTVKLPWIHERTKLAPLSHSDTEKLFFGEAVFLVKTFFFVYLGISIQLDDYVALATGLALVGGLLLARVLGIQLATRLLGGTSDDLVSMSILIPKGTAAAVLAGLPIQLGLARGAQMQDLVYGVVFVSILATAILVYLAERARPAKKRA